VRVGTYLDNGEPRCSAPCIALDLIFRRRPVAQMPGGVGYSYFDVQVGAFLVILFFTYMLLALFFSLVTLLLSFLGIFSAVQGQFDTIHSLSCITKT